jgi:hypothetical protein
VLPKWKFYFNDILLQKTYLTNYEEVEGAKQEFIYFMEKNNAKDIHWKRAVVCLVLFLCQRPSRS